MSSNGKVTNDALDLYPSESEFGLELKAVPKKTCIPHKHHQIGNSESSTPKRRSAVDTQLRNAVMSLNIQRRREE
ncbi:uncharacterized protein LOC117895814 [Drosophila subobscura]|uniref:uncharacterized protein LOC117895814 n=1 Tax=Drosophila subobscura TaxID=7241 RepID=UPI00155A767C|nr:uncharacterized protein LOC117895814 [Drosophila subobscura]